MSPYGEPSLPLAGTHNSMGYCTIFLRLHNKGLTITLWQRPTMTTTGTRTSHQRPRIAVDKSLPCHLAV
jgi:hypothetical protein